MWKLNLSLLRIMQEIRMRIYIFKIWFVFQIGNGYRNRCVCTRECHLWKLRHALLRFLLLMVLERCEYVKSYLQSYDCVYSCTCEWGVCTCTRAFCVCVRVCVRGVRGVRVLSWLPMCNMLFNNENISRNWLFDSTQACKQTTHFTPMPTD